MSLGSRWIANLVWEWPARRLNLLQHAHLLESSGQAIGRASAAAPDGDFNRRLLSHIVGIERWAQRRVRVALGAPLLMDEYNGYRPPRETGWAELQQQFQTTRQASVQLARDLATAGAPLDMTILHNSYGPLTPRAWLRYMTVHANLESKKLRRS